MIIRVIEFVGGVALVLIVLDSAVRTFVLPRGSVVRLTRLVWQERDPYLLAQSLDLIVKDKSVGLALRQKGERRYEQMYTNERIEAEFLRALDTLL